MHRTEKNTGKLKVLFVLTEGWFFLSHFKPLADAINSDDRYQAGIITTVGSNRQKLEELGLKVHPIDFQRASFSLLSAAKICLQLISILREQRPDIVHFVALKPILIGGLATMFTPKSTQVFHVTGMGYLADGRSMHANLRRNFLFRLVAFFFNRARSWLITENPDDLAIFAKHGAQTNKRTSILGGAGVDPDYFAMVPATGNAVPKAAFVGRMIWSKGVDVLMEAKSKLTKNGVELELDMFGAPDTGNPRAIQEETLQEWDRKPGVNWHGHIYDVRKAWRHTDIAIFPSRGGEGLPRAILEAASCGRALIVTNVPGCKHFVRHGIEGLVVPPDDPVALADAMQKLAQDPELRHAMGEAARQRVLTGYTEQHLRTAVLRIYQNLLTHNADELD